MNFATLGVPSIIFCSLKFNKRSIHRYEFSSRSILTEKHQPPCSNLDQQPLKDRIPSKNEVYQCLNNYDYVCLHWAKNQYHSMNTHGALLYHTCGIILNNKLLHSVYSNGSRPLTLRNLGQDNGCRIKRRYVVAVVVLITGSRLQCIHARARSVRVYTKQANANQWMKHVNLPDRVATEA